MFIDITGIDLLDQNDGMIGRNSEKCERKCNFGPKLAP